MVALEEMRTRGQVPKLGALQRWVRDCDAASAKNGVYAQGDPVVLRVLDSMLRTVDPTMIPTKADEEEEHPVRKHPMWAAFPRIEDSVQKYEAVLAKELFSKLVLCSTVIA